MIAEESVLNVPHILKCFGDIGASYIQLQRLGSQGSLHRLQARAGSNRKNWMIIILYYIIFIVYPCLPLTTMAFLALVTMFLTWEYIHTCMMWIVIRSAMF